MIAYIEKTLNLIKPIATDELAVELFETLKKLGTPLIYSVFSSIHTVLKLDPPSLKDILDKSKGEFFLRDSEIIYVELEPSFNQLRYGYIGSSLQPKLFDTLSLVIQKLLRAKKVEFIEQPLGTHLELFNPQALPQVPPEKINALKKLANPQVMQFLTILEEYDRGIYLRELEKVAPISRDLLNELIANGLVIKDYLIICRLTGRQILRISSLETIKEAEKKGFKCFMCGKPLSEEIFEEAIFITPSITEYLKGNRWLLSLLIYVLTEELAIPKDMISFDTPEKYYNIILQLPMGNILITVLPQEFTTQDIYMIEAYVSAYSAETLIVISDKPIIKLLTDYLTSKGIDVYSITEFSELKEELSLILSDKLLKHVQLKFKEKLASMSVDLWEAFKDKVINMLGGDKLKERIESFSIPSALKGQSSEVKPRIASKVKTTGTSSPEVSGPELKESITRTLETSNKKVSQESGIVDISSLIGIEE